MTGKIHAKGIRSKLLLLGGCLPLVLSISPPGARAAEGKITLDVRHHHAVGSCRGTLILDSGGARYQTNHKKDARTWTFEDIKQWRVSSGEIEIYSYEDRKWRLGADKTFVFEWDTRKTAPQEIYDFLEAHTSRPIAAWLAPADGGKIQYEFPVKHLGGITGNQGRLFFAQDHVIYRSDAKNASRAWRYEDLESIASAGIYDLTLTTYEQQKLHYASRRVYNFQLKQALSPEKYDELWRFVNAKKTGS